MPKHTGSTELRGLPPSSQTLKCSWGRNVSSSPGAGLTPGVAAGLGVNMNGMTGGNMMLNMGGMQAIAPLINPQTLQALQPGLLAGQAMYAQQAVPQIHPGALQALIAAQQQVMQAQAQAQAGQSLPMTAQHQMLMQQGAPGALAGQQMVMGVQHAGTPLAVDQRSMYYGMYYGK